MKKQIKAGLACLLIFFVSFACKSSDEPEPESKTEQVAILAKMPETLATDTKTQLASDGMSVQWSAGDRVTVFMPSPVDGKLHSGVYTIDDATVNTGSPLFKGELLWQKENENHTFYSCYPVVSGCDDAAKLPVALPAAQTQAGATSAHLADLDRLVAVAATQKAPSSFTNSYTSVSMYYHHLFAIIEVRVYSRTPGKSVSKVIMESSKTNLSLTEGVVDLTLPASDPGFGKVSGAKGGNTVTLTITNPAEAPVVLSGDLTFDNTLPNYLVVCPGDHTGGSFTFTLETSGGQKEYPQDGRVIHAEDKLILYLEI